MKKGVYLGVLLTGMLSSMLCFTSMADYEEDTGWSANREYNRRLNPELDAAIEKKAELEAEYEALGPELEALKAKYEEVAAAYEAGEVDFPAYDKIEYEYVNMKKRYQSLPKLIEEAQETIDVLTELLDEAVEEGMEWTGYTQEGDEDITYTFHLVNEDGNWLLKAAYRGWSNFMGGRWEYSTFVTDELRIAFYDGDTCLVSRVDRASEYDTETTLAWDVPDNLVAGKKYYVKISNKKYGLYAEDDYSHYDSGNDNDNDYSYDDSGNDNDYSYDDSGDNHDDDYETDNDYDDDSTDNEEGRYEQDSTSTNHGQKECYWMQNAIGWWLQCYDGTYLTNQWYQSPVSGLWYYMGADGYMLTNTVTPDGYIVNTDGVWVQ